jgi:MFS family permease
VGDPVRRYAWLSFLQWLPVGLTIVPMVLLLLERGLTLAEIAVLGAVSGLTTAALELPTGGLADVVGRRPVLVLSALAHAVALVVLALASGLALLASSAALRGLARALSSGPLEAWYVDTARADRRPGDQHGAHLTTGLARGELAASVALGVGTVIGGVVPFLLDGTTLPVPALAVPVLLAAAVEVVRLGVTVGLPDVVPQTGTLREALRAVPGTVGAGVRLAGRDRLVLRLLVSGAAMGVALGVIELVTPAWTDLLSDAAGQAAIAYAALATVGFAADAAGASLAPAARRRLRTPARAATTATAVALAGAIALVAASEVDDRAALLGAGLAYVCVFVGLGVAGPPMGELLHGQVGSAERATVLSVQSLLFQVAGSGGAILAGWLAVQHGAAAGFLVAAGGLAAACTLLATAGAPASTA